MTKYRPEIDGLRAIAVLLVIFFHAGFAWIKAGFLGVDIFFVISGYLITQMMAKDLDQKSFDVFKFWLKRARRILPMLIVMTLLCLVAGWFLFLPQDFKSLGRSAVALSLFVSNVYFYLKSGYFAIPATTQPLLHTWSLAVEEQFYFCFPLVLWVLTRYLIALRTLCVFLLMLLSLIFAVSEIKSSEIFTFFLLPTRTWELFMGSVAALYFLHDKKLVMRSWLNEVGSLLGLLLITSGVFYYCQNSVFSVLSQFMVCLGTVAILVSNQKKLTFVGVILSLPILVWIGLLSYSLYLWHWPLLVFTQYITIGKLSSCQIIFILTSSLILSWISYYWIETPVRKKRILIHPKLFLGIIILTLALIGTLGLIINFKNGFPNRLSPHLRAVYEETSHPMEICQPLNVSGNLRVCSNAPIAETPDFILWGDSHAMMMFSLLDELAKHYRLKFWYYACPPPLGVYSMSQNDSLTNSNCLESGEELMRVIKKRGIKNVLFASFWEQFVEGREVPLEGAGERDPFYADSATPSSTVEEARFVFQKHFIETVKQLENLGVTIWIMKQVPFYPYWPSNQLVKTLKYGGDPSKIGRPLSECLSREVFINHVFDQLSSDKVHLLDPNTLLCRTNFCYGTEDEHSLYFDFNHLSSNGAMKLRPLFTDMFIFISKDSRRK